jgi:hypothetical protein
VAQLNATIEDFRRDRDHWRAEAADWKAQAQRGRLALRDLHQHMHTVIETPTFLSDCRRAGLSEDGRLAIVDAIADDPLAGDVITGTGGARKRRFPGRGKGKSGGYRVISYYAGAVPVLLLALVDKGERTDLTQGERNALASELRTYAREYRMTAAARAARQRRR